MTQATKKSTARSRPPSKSKPSKPRSRAKPKRVVAKAKPSRAKAATKRAPARKPPATSARKAAAKRPAPKRPAAKSASKPARKSTVRPVKRPAAKPARKSTARKPAGGKNRTVARAQRPAARRAVRSAPARPPARRTRATVRRTPAARPGPKRIRAPAPRAAAKPARGRGKPLNVRVGQQVVYSAHGVGRVRGVQAHTVDGQRLSTLVVLFERDNLLLRLPKAEVSNLGLRHLSTPRKIGEALRVLQQKPEVKRKMWSQRAKEYTEKINSGNVLLVAEVLRDLHREDTGKSPPSYSERQLYEQARDRLVQEGAAVYKLSEEAVDERVEKALSKRPPLRAAGGRAEEEDDDD